MDRVDHIIYINLDHRADRRAEFEAQLARLNIPSEKVTRFSAIKHSYSPAGCNLSHASVLRLAHQNGYKNVLIFEDDFNFIDDLDYVNTSITEFFEKVSHFDGCLLVRTLPTSEIAPFQGSDIIVHLKKAANAAAQIISAEEMLPLAELIESVTEPLIKTHQHWLYVNDVIWNQRIRTGKWYAFQQNLGQQRPSFSDLCGQYTDNRHLFIKS